VTNDHFLVVRLDSDSLSRIFSGVFAYSGYHKFLESQIQKTGSAYWVFFPELVPDGDLFVLLLANFFAARKGSSRNCSRYILLNLES
jgi:hypothetical protein